MLAIVFALLLFACASLAENLEPLLHAHSRWTSSPQGAQNDTLLVFATANVGHRTSGFLASLSTVRDEFHLLAVDEASSDNTLGDLAAYNVPVLRVKEYIGVTALWNRAYQYYLEHGYDKLIISNNDVLVPDGVVDKLQAALNNGCDLVTPLSTKLGKGHIGNQEGIEVCFTTCSVVGAVVLQSIDHTACKQVLYNLPEHARKLVNNPGNYQLVQNVLDELNRAKDVKDMLWTGRDTFNGFFFAMSSRIKAAAFNHTHLFRPDLHNFDQV